MSRTGELWQVGRVIHRFRATWAVAFMGSLVLGALLVGASGPAVAAPSGGTTLPTFASVPSPIAVSATTTSLIVLSSSSCTSVYSVAPNGQANSHFATISTSVKKCNEAAIAVSPGLGGFPAGEIYVLESDGSLYAIAPAGGTASLILSDSANLAGTYLGLAFDYTGSFGYALIATGGKAGNAVAITAQLTATAGASSPNAYTETYLASFGTYVEGPAVAPSGYGSYGGDLMVASEGQSNVYALAPQTSTPLVFTQWSNSEAVSFVPTLACSYSTTGYSYFVADTADNALLGFSSSTFSGLSNSALILSEYKGAGVDIISSTGSSSVLSVPGKTLDGASYVACPLGVTQKIDLTGNGLGVDVAPNVPDTTLNLIGFDPVGGWLVGTDSQHAPNEVFFVNGTTGALSTSSPVFVGIEASSVTYSPKGNTLYVAGTADGTVTNTLSGAGYLTLLNASTLAPLGPVPSLLVDKSAGATQTVFDSYGTKLYVACSGGNVFLYSVPSNQFSNPSQVVSLPGTPTGMVVDPTDGNVYVTGNVGSEGVVWEVHLFNLIQTLDVGVGSNPVAIDVNPNSGLLYVAAEGANEVVFVATGDVQTGSVPVTSPVGVAYNDQTGYLFVDSSTGTMTIFDGSSVVATFPLGSSPGPLVYDPYNGIVYVCAYVPDPRIILGTSG